MEDLLIAGAWRPADATDSFRAIDPQTGQTLDHVYPVSSAADVETALRAGHEAARDLARVPREVLARCLDGYAERIEQRTDAICDVAQLETALPVSPRLADVELPRTTDQLRQAATAARDRGWTLPTLDTATNIRSMYGPLGGPVVVFGPNNFPLAFNGISGGDFAAALAAGNPVIAKAHPSHPRTSQLLAQAAFEAVTAAGLPPATIQMVYRTSHADGALLVSHPLVAATGYTGSRKAGLVLKAAADGAGKPIYLEMSSVNPVFLLPAVLAERADDLAAELAGSVLLGTGQFCTSPGVVVVREGASAEAFVDGIRQRFASAAVGALLSPSGVDQLDRSVGTLRHAGADVVTGGEIADAPGCRYQNTLLRTTGEAFLGAPDALQTEAFGNATLVVVAADADQMAEIAESVEGSLTGTLYSDPGGVDDALYAHLAPRLRRRVGRLLNDKMPTGVAVVPSMNHGGPYPATGHPGFSAVGLPGSMRRFAMLECYDNVREHRLPDELRDQPPTAGLWRQIDGQWMKT